MIENLRIEYIEEELPIEELYDLNYSEESAFTSNGHELIDVEDLNVLGYTSNIYDEGSVEYLPVKRLIRHKVSKGKWELIVKDCNGDDISVVTTEDHGLIAYDDGKLIRLSPFEFVHGGYDTIVINDDGESRLFKIESLSKIGDFDDEYVYDVEMQNDPHTFFANDILIHNSIYITLRPLFEHLDIKLLESEERIVGKPMKVTKEAMDIITELGGEGNPADGIITKHLEKWAKTELNSVDSRFMFAREKISKRGIFLNAKKRYVVQVVDNEGIPVPVGSKKEFSYTGVEVVSSTYAKEVQNMMKEMIQTMIISKDMKESNLAVVNAYSEFCELSPVILATRKSVKDLKKYAPNSTGFQIGKGTPQNSKASLLYNNMIDHLTLGKEYEKIKSGDKIKILYVAKNRFGLEYIGFKDVFPPEFGLAPDYRKLYLKHVHPVMDRMFQAVSWDITNPTKNYECDIISEFS